MIPTSDRPTFSLELHELLLWFGKLRWFAAAGLALGALAGLRFGTLQLWPTLLILAITVASYNLLCWWLLLRLLGEDSFLTNLQVTSIVEIVLDLSVLLVVVHLTGGLASPIAPFFIFHMAIGIAMLSARTMFVIATGTCIAMVLLHIGESSAYLSRHAIADGPDAYGALPGLRFAVLLAVVFGTVYLTWTVKQRSEEYKRIADFVAEEGRQKLEEAFSEISDLENRKSHFMRISAHQLRSPLGTIKTTLQVITKGYTDADSDRGKRLLNGAVERTDELLSIVNDLLELAKIREGQEKAFLSMNSSSNGETVFTGEELGSPSFPACCCPLLLRHCSGCQNSVEFQSRVLFEQNSSVLPMIPRRSRKSAGTTWKHRPNHCCVKESKESISMPSTDWKRYGVSVN